MRRYWLVPVIIAIGISAAFAAGLGGRRNRQGDTILSGKEIKRLAEVARQTDTITLTNGETIECRISKITPKHIEYGQGKVDKRKVRKVEIVCCRTVTILFSTPPMQPIIKVEDAKPEMVAHHSPDS